MALILYFDEEATEEVTVQNPDRTKETVVMGNSLASERILFVKSDDENLTYENIVISAAEGDSSANIQYAFDNGGVPGSYMSALTIMDGDFSEPVAFWRKVVSGAVEYPFKRQDIEHEIAYDAYLK